VGGGDWEPHWKAVCVGVLVCELPGGTKVKCNNGGDGALLRCVCMCVWGGGAGGCLRAVCDRGVRVGRRKRGQ